MVNKHPAKSDYYPCYSLSHLSSEDGLPCAFCPVLTKSLKTDSVPSALSLAPSCTDTPSPALLVLGHKGGKQGVAMVTSKLGIKTQRGS